MVIEPGDDMGISPATSRCDFRSCRMFDYWRVAGGYSIFMAGKLLENTAEIIRIIEHFLHALVAGRKAKA